MWEFELGVGRVFRIRDGKSWGWLESGLGIIGLGLGLQLGLGKVGF